MGYCDCTGPNFHRVTCVTKKFAWGPLKDVMDKRERDINRDIDDAEQAKLNAQKLEEENKQNLKKHKKKFKRF